MVSLSNLLKRPAWWRLFLTLQSCLELDPFWAFREDRAGKNTLFPLQDLGFDLMQYWAQVKRPQKYSWPCFRLDEQIAGSLLLSRRRSQGGAHSLQWLISSWALPNLAYVCSEYMDKGIQLISKALGVAWASLTSIWPPYTAFLGHKTFKARSKKNLQLDSGCLISTTLVWDQSWNTMTDLFLDECK